MDEDYEQFLEFGGLEDNENLLPEEDSSNSSEDSVVVDSHAEHEIPSASKKSRGKAMAYEPWKEFDNRDQFEAFWGPKKTNWRIRRENDAKMGVTEIWNCVFNQRSNKGINIKDQRIGSKLFILFRLFLCCSYKDFFLKQ